MSHLPGQRIPLTADRWPTREDMVRYFDDYVRPDFVRPERPIDMTIWPLRRSRIFGIRFPARRARAR
jgi:hypothetical protein